MVNGLVIGTELLGLHTSSSRSEYINTRIRNRITTGKVYELKEFFSLRMKDNLYTSNSFVVPQIFLESVTLELKRNQTEECPFTKYYLEINLLT